MDTWAAITAAVLAVVGLAAIIAALLASAHHTHRFRWILGGSSLSLPLLISAEALTIAYGLR